MKPLQVSMQSPAAQNNKCFFMTLGICLALFLIYPNRLVCFAPDWIFFGFTTATISMLAAGFLLFRKDDIVCFFQSAPKYWKTAFLFLAAILFVSGIVHTPLYSVFDWWKSLSYLVLPLFACIFHRELKNILTPALACLWLLNILQSLTESLVFHSPYLGGLAMNINWNATLTAVTLPFAWQWLSLRYSSSKNTRYAAYLFVILTSLYVFLQCHPLASTISVLTAVLITVLLNMENKRLRTKIFSVLCISCIIAIIATVSLCHNQISAFINQTDRAFFAKQTMKLIADAPWTGHGIPSFEQAFIPYRTEEYYGMTYAAARVNHPHNHELFMTAGTGILGLIAWLTLLLLPSILFAVKKYKTADNFSKLCFYGLIVLFIHGQFDLTLYNEPLNIIAWLFLGILWKECYPCTEYNSAQTGIGWQIGGAVIALSALGLTLCTCCASALFRYGERQRRNGNHESAQTAFLNVLKIPVYDCEHTLKLPIALYFSRSPERENRVLALTILESFDRTAIQDFAHTHLIRGKLLFMEGKPEAATKELLREAEIYPLDPYPFLALWYYYVETGNKNGAFAVANELNERFRKLHLDAEIKNKTPVSWNFAEIEGKDGPGLLNGKIKNIYGRKPQGTKN